MCEKDQCVIKKEDAIYFVESDLTEIEEDKLRIRYDINDSDGVIHIIVIVNDEETAELIKDKINVAINEHSKEEIVKHFKSVKMIMIENKLSISSGTMKKERIIFLFINAFITFVIQ